MEEPDMNGVNTTATRATSPPQSGLTRSPAKPPSPSAVAEVDLHAAITAAIQHSPNFNNFRRAISLTPTITTVR
jgi:hypothetical protein